ncbi:hypothetical protein Tco_0597929 [Tanacetum coccineum]
MIIFSGLSVDEFVVSCQCSFSWFFEFQYVKDRAPPPLNLWMDLNAFIRTADPRKVRIVERPRAENERPIVTVAKHRTVTLLPTSVVRSSGELSASYGREFVGAASVWLMVEIRDFDSVAVKDTCASPSPKRLRADYGTTGGSVTGGKSPSVLNRLLQDSRLTVEQGVPALPTLPFITSSVTASPLEEGGDRTDSVTGPSLRTIGPPQGLLYRLLNEGYPVATVVLREVRYGVVVFDAGVSAAEGKRLSLAEEKNILLEAKDKEIEDLKFQLLKAKEESAEVTQLRAQVSGLEATENSLRGEVASAQDHNVLLEQECSSLKLKVTGLESTIAEKDHELSDLGASSSS